MPGAFAIQSRRMCHPSFQRERGTIASMLMVSNIVGRDRHRTGRFRLVSSAITARHAKTAHADRVRALDVVSAVAYPEVVRERDVMFREDTSDSSGLWSRAPPGAELWMLSSQLA